MPHARALTDGRGIVGNFGRSMADTTDEEAAALVAFYHPVAARTKESKLFHHHFSDDTVDATKNTQHFLIAFEV